MSLLRLDFFINGDYFHEVRTHTDCGLITDLQTVNLHKSQSNNTEKILSTVLFIQSLCTSVYEFAISILYTVFYMYINKGTGKGVLVHAIKSYIGMEA